jgi:hypothetical protein
LEHQQRWLPLDHATRYDFFHVLTEGKQPFTIGGSNRELGVVYLHPFSGEV